MLTKIRRKTCIDQHAIFPLRGYDSEKEEEEFFYPPVFKSYILTLPSRSFRGHLTALGKEMTKLAGALYKGNLIFQGDTEAPWLYQDSDYGPVKDAQRYLADSKIGKRFNGALQADMAALPSFIIHLAWLTRCNAALPYFHFIDEEENILGHLCQYGNLHIDTLHQESDLRFRSFVASSRFIYGDKTACTKQFGNRNAIAERQKEI